MQKYHYNLGLYFYDVISTNSKRKALHYKDQVFSFSELSESVEKLAKLLISLEINKGDIIVIGHNKKPLSYGLMLASIRLGIPYLSIDVESPISRNHNILSTSAASFLFFDDIQYQDSMKELSDLSGCISYFLDESILPIVTDEDRKIQLDRAEKVDGSCIAYIMFTSGSTGTPKGVAVTHQNVLHFIAWGQQRFNITHKDNFANLSPMYFDNSVFDFYVGLFSGASLTPFPRELLTKPYDVVNYLGDSKCTIWFSVPSLLMYLNTMKAFSSEKENQLRLIIFGGEGYPKVELKKLYDIFHAQATLVNVYGPTECTCICSAYDINKSDFEDLSGIPTLGYLNQNFDYQILDENNIEAEIGELCLIGPNVASGYFNDIERSNESFVTITTPSRFFKRMYHTGDLVERKKGKLYFVGRKDNQIKHMGYRIELEEIEHALIKIDGINQAAVVYERKQVTFGKLYGFVASDEKLSEEVILNKLRSILPDYMIPSKIYIQPILPKNQNGKVDKQQLKNLLR